MKGEIVGGGSLNITYGIPIQNLSKLVVGQPIIGFTEDSVYKVCFGIFCSDVYGPSGTFSMNFSGRLSYSNGTSIIYSPVKITVRYMQYQYENKNATNGLGEFFIKLDDLPQTMMYKDLDISINVESAVEASYNCLYNYTCQTCFKRPGSQNCP